MRVDGYYLDRYPVTNAQYHQFVRHGGYEQMAIWDPEIWPAVLDFVDTTGHAGPRFWRDGRYPRGEDHHPVVGVSWYEAAAYARWVGKRLPTRCRMGQSRQLAGVASPAIRCCSAAIRGAKPWTAAGPTCGARARAARSASTSFPAASAWAACIS